jgi:tetratricopeptide (TPR) repeat protein
MFSYETAKQDEKTFLSLTSLTVHEFSELCAVFGKHWNEFIKQSEKNPSKGGRPHALKTMEDRLLFILFYLKTYPLQEVIAYSFGISQGAANILIHQFSHILKLALQEGGFIPARITDEMLARLNQENPQDYGVDGTERRIVRPSNPDAERGFYSGKKKATLQLRELIAVLENQPDAADELASALNDLADFLAAQGQCGGEVLVLYRRALALFEASGGTEQPDAANVLNNLASVHYDLGEYGEAEALAERAVAIMDGLFAQEELVADTDTDTLALCQRIRRHALSQQGAARRAQGRYVEAEAPSRRAVALMEEHFGPDNEETATSLNDLGVLYKYWGRYDQAETVYRRAHLILESLYGPDAPELAGILYNLAGLDHARGRYAEAEPLCRQALALQETAFADDHPKLAVTRGTLAAILDGQGQYDEAEALYRRALATHVARHGTEHPEVALNLNNLGAIAEARGRLAEAEALYLRALHIRERCLGPEHPQTATCLNNLGMLYPAIGKGREAETLFRRALDILEKTAGPNHPHTLICREHWEAARTSGGA